jgi:hypothetical protein
VAGMPAAARTPSMTPSGPAEAKGAYSAFAVPCVDALDEGNGCVAREDDRSQQWRIDRTPPGRTVTQNRHVVDLAQGAGLVDDRDRALNANIDAEVAGVLSVHRRISKADVVGRTVIWPRPMTALAFLFGRLRRRISA